MVKLDGRKCLGCQNKKSIFYFGYKLNKHKSLFNGKVRAKMFMCQNKSLKVYLMVRLG